MTETGDENYLRSLINSEMKNTEMAIFGVYLDELKHRNRPGSNFYHAEKFARQVVEPLFNNWKLLFPNCFDEESRLGVNLEIDTDSDGDPKPGTSTFFFHIVTKHHDIIKTMSYKKWTQS